MLGGLAKRQGNIVGRGMERKADHATRGGKREGEGKIWWSDGKWAGRGSKGAWVGRDGSVWETRGDGETIVELRGVTKVYGKGAGELRALKGIDLRVERGEIVAVCGRSGSGKSTLLNMVAGIDRPTAGEVLVDGSALNRLSEGALAVWRGRHLGIVFQFFQLLPTLSLAENVMLPMDFCHTHQRGRRRERAEHLLAQVGLAAQANQRPAAVSGGQQQRAAIARALANDPPVIVADEPTGNLDSANATAVFNLFWDLAARGKTILIVTHDASLARSATRRVILDDGLVVDEVRNEPARARRLDFATGGWPQRGEVEDV